jgi:hypothetical protein
VNLLQLREDIPLGEAELSAVEDGLTAYEQLLAKLADVPTPAGPTPRQLGRDHLVQLQVGRGLSPSQVSVGFPADNSAEGDGGTPTAQEPHLSP